MKVPLGVVGLALLAACTSSHPQNARTSSIDDAQIGRASAHFDYTGEWEHISGRRDGRLDGTSSRSRHAGDSLIIPFSGSALRIYGVRGPNGGNATVAIDGKYLGVANFFAPQKQAHALVFASPPLAEGNHVFGLLVAGDPREPHRLYVNVDSAEVLHQQ